MSPAKPTTYKGIKYRSKSEAKLAVCFDSWGWKHEYEPLVEHEKWRPDFLIHGTILGKKAAMLIEYKPSLPNADYLNELHNHFGSFIECKENGVAGFLGVELLVCELWCIDFWNDDAMGLRFLDLRRVQIIDDELMIRDYSPGKSFRFDLF